MHLLIHALRPHFTYGGSKDLVVEKMILSDVDQHFRLPGDALSMMPHVSRIFRHLTKRSLELTHFPVPPGVQFPKPKTPWPKKSNEDRNSLSCVGIFRLYNILFYALSTRTFHLISSWFLKYMYDGRTAEDTWFNI